MKFKKSLQFALSVAIIIFAIYLLLQSSWNFTLLGVVAILCVVVMHLPQFYMSDSDFKGYYNIKKDERMPGIHVPSIKNPLIDLFFGNIVLALFIVATFATVDNYFFADRRVYGNNVHHALRADGIRIHNAEGFVLAKNDSTAFFDNKNLNGEVVIDRFDEEGVTLNLVGFTHPVYSNHNNIDSLLNPIGSIVEFTSDERITFVNQAGKNVDFWFEEFDNQSWVSSYENRDSANYYFYIEGESAQKSAINTLFVQGYNMNTLLDGVEIDDFDFEGISLVRSKATPQAKHINRSDNGHTRFALEFSKTAFESGIAGIAKVIQGNKVYTLNSANDFCGQLKIPYNTDIVIGYGENKSRTFYFENDSTCGQLALKLKMPLYSVLYSQNGKECQNIYVTNSLVNDLHQKGERSIGANVPDNVVHLRLFNSHHNINKFNPYRIAFTPGETQERMHFYVQRGDGLGFEYTAGENMAEIGAGNNVDWIFTIENLRNSTPYGATKMLWLIFGVALASVLLLNIPVFGGLNIHKYHRCSFSFAEFTAYIVIIYLIAIRGFLMWRTTVFRPLENISSHELETIFYTSDHFDYLIFGLLLFFLIIGSLKFFLLKYRNKNKAKSVDQILYNDSVYFILDNLILWMKKKRAYIVWSSYIFATVAGMVWNSRVGLLLVVVSYFLVDFVINIREDNPAGKENNDGDKAGINALTSLGLTILNLGVAMSSMYAIRDTGFLMLFVTFSLLVVSIKVLELYKKLYTTTGLKLLAVYLIMFLLDIFILAFYKELIIAAVNSSYFIIGVAIVMALLLAVIFKAVLKKVFSKNPVVILSWAVVAAMFVGGYYFASTDSKISDTLGDHTKQRINVQLYSPDEALEMTETNGDELRFLQASHNHWIIEQYHDRSKNVSLFGEEGMGYFKLNPHSKLGAMWGAQMTDIVLLRYIITEHSKILPVLLLALFLLMLYCGMRMTTYFRFTKSLLIQIPLLLFVQATLVWLANSQRFIFFGQDFPVISINSKVMLLYVFVLMTIWTAAAVLEGVMYLNHNRKEFENIRPFNEFHSLLVTGFLGAVILVALFSWEPGNDDGCEKYNMEALIERVEPYINDIDSLFAEYQHLRPDSIALKNNMQPVVADFNYRYGDVIVTTLKTRAANNANDSTAYKFPLRMWKNFAERGSRHNNYFSLVHIRNNNNRLEISLRKNYYDLCLPTVNANEWKGNIVEEYAAVSQPADTVIHSTDYTFYHLPAEWNIDGKTSYNILKYKGEKDMDIFSLASNMNTDVSNHGVEQVVVLTEKDRVFVSDSLLDSLPIQTHTYWARNILVNGRQTFIYPQAEELFWIRAFASVVKNSEEHNMQSCKASDVPVTLNRELTSTLRGRLKDMSTNIANSVIVADGDGKVRVMADYKRGYELDPNDEVKIKALDEALYMNIKGNNIVEENKYFGNHNFTHLQAGPGSTQKPLIWNGVASYIDYDWANLELNKFQGQIQYRQKYATGRYIISRFNGERVASFMSIPRDEGLGVENVDLVKYLAKSSNYYNALMVYIGLHSKELYDDKNFIQRPAYNSTDTMKVFKFQKAGSNYSDNFPFMTIGAKQQSVVLNKKIERADIHQSVLYEQMTNMYGLNDAFHTKRTTADNLYADYLHDSVSNPYVLPVNSSLNFNRFQNPNDDGFIHVNNIMRSIAIGDMSAWNVTPFAMAQMYGRIISLNPEYSLTFNPSAQNKGKIGEIGKNNEGFKKARQKMFYGMYQFFSIGTGKRIRPNIEYINPQKKIPEPGVVKYNDKCYYLYGKTGTTDDDKYDYSRLAIVISDTKLHNCSSAEAEKAKFYVLFFTFDYMKDGYSETASRIIEDVIKSDVFCNYMNNSNKTQDHE